LAQASKSSPSSVGLLGTAPMELRDGLVLASWSDEEAEDQLFCSRRGTTRGAKVALCVSFAALVYLISVRDGVRAMRGTGEEAPAVADVRAVLGAATEEHLHAATVTASTAAPASVEEAQEGLPPGWQAVWADAQKQYYYYKQSTGETQWERPLDAQVPSRWELGAAGSTCYQACIASGLACGAAHIEKARNLTSNEAVGAAYLAATGEACPGFHPAEDYAGTPFFTEDSRQLCAPFTAENGKAPVCDGNTYGHHRPLCFCEKAVPVTSTTSTPAPNSGWGWGWGAAATETTTATTMTETTTTQPWWSQVPLPGREVASTTAPHQTRREDWFNMLAGGDGIGMPLTPRASMHDGNICGDDEEFHEGLCYKKCGTLTLGVYPIRTSAWTCCKNRPCTWQNSNHKVGMCSGFDVAGDHDHQGNQACPHLPGACLTNEELYMGMCYKKCSILAPAYPIRFAASTCCRISGIYCAEPSNGVTSPGYAVGGGDGSSRISPKDAHPPLPELTEALRRK